MALQKSTQSPTLVKVVGETTELIVGIAGGSGTSTATTIPNFSKVYGAVAIPTSGTTAIYVGTTSGNSFTATHGSGKSFMYIAWGKAKI